MNMTEKSNTRPRPRGRPRKAPDELVSRQQLIRAGLICLTERGFSDVSLDEVLKTAGVTKGSFYHHFKSKADYGMALVEAYDDYFAQTLTSWFSRDDISPIERLRGFTISAEHGMAKYAFRRGCLIGNLGQEMASLPPEITEKLISVLESWQAKTAAFEMLLLQVRFLLPKTQMNSPPFSGLVGKVRCCAQNLNANRSPFAILPTAFSNSLRTKGNPYV